MPREIGLTGSDRTGERFTVTEDDDMAARLTLAGKINALIETRGLSQVQAASLLGMSQPKVSAIRNHKLQGISLQRLMLALTALGQQVEIVVTPSAAGQRRISVAA